MTKQELSQLRYLNKEIDILKMQIKDLEDKAEKQTASDVVSGSNPVFPYERRRFHIEGIDMKIYEKRLRRLRQKLNKRMEQLIRQRERLEAYISGIDDSMIRIILTLRYVEGLSWRQIAHRVGGGNTPDSVRKMHDRFLKGSGTFDKSNKEKTVSIINHELDEIIKQQEKPSKENSLFANFTARMADKIKQHDEFMASMQKK